MANPLRVTVWNEFIHENRSESIRTIYPAGIHGAIASALAERLGPAVAVRTATLEEPDHGLSEAALAETDVLIWWGHAAHDDVDDAVVDRVHQRVLSGMGLIVLHSGHYSKIFKRLMGTGCGLKWREAGELERLWCVSPGHPICDGLPEHFELRHTEMYGEFFDIPTPDELVFISWFEGGNVFRSGCTWRRGKGKVFYFRPGHESYPIFHDPHVQQVLANATRWAAPTEGAPYTFKSPKTPTPLNPIRPR